MEGHIPDKGLTSILLDTDYLCLIVSPDHPFADRKDVSLEEVKKERLIVRPRGAGTRHMFETYLEGCGESLQNFHVILEIDSVSTIKDLVQSNLGVSVIAIINFQTFHEINLVCREDFSQKQLLDELCNIYRTCM